MILVNCETWGNLDTFYRCCEPNSWLLTDHRAIHDVHYRLWRYDFHFYDMFPMWTFSGFVRQYRLFRLHVNFGTDNYLYPYDKQIPQIKLQSIDYGEEIIKLTTKQLNTLNGVDTAKTKVTKTETTLSSATVQHENYISNSEWNWQSYNYEISPVTSVVRNGVKFSQDWLWTEFTPIYAMVHKL